MRHFEVTIYDNDGADTIRLRITVGPIGLR
jgi:hypothetical protein